MRGLGLRGRRESRPIARSVAAGAQGLNLAQVGKQTGRRVQSSKIGHTQRTSAGGLEVVPPEELQEVLWKQFFTATAEWWDNRRSKPSPLHPDFRHKESKVPLWLHNRHKPVWVDFKLATLDAAVLTPLDSVCITAQPPGAFPATKGRLEVGMCRKVCEDGVLCHAVDALDQLVQRGCHVPGNLFYRVLKRCIQNKDLASGRRIHSLTVRSGHEGDAFLATHLINLYASHGRLEEALEVFNKVSAPDAYNWATIIFAYARHGGAAEAAKAIRLYKQMGESATIQLDDRLYSAVLKACAVAKDLITGKEVHACVIARPGKPDRFVQTGLVNMYVKCGSLGDARRLFDTLSEKDVVTWNTMIAGYTQQQMGQDALNLYRIMQKEGITRPCSLTYAFLLQVCGGMGKGALDVGKQLHSEIKAGGLEEDVVLGSSLVNMYVKCGGLEDARSIFQRLSHRDVVTWTAMIAGYAQQGMGWEALSLYRNMQQEGLTPDCVTYVCLLQACAAIGSAALEDGKQLHTQIGERGLEDDAVLSGSLVNMYVKCSSLEEAHRWLDKLPKRTTAAWTAMIAGYAQHGMGQEALHLHSSMRQHGLTPDFVTYVSLLQACASVGVAALQAGKQLHVQIKERGLEGEVIMGGSLVNMYANCGSLEDARMLFDKLPNRNVVTWNTLIAGYVQQGMGQEALGLYSSMQREGLLPDSVTYVCLLQACASLGAGALLKGKRLHSQIREQGVEEDVVLANSLVNMYVKCGSLGDALTLLEKLPERSVVAWTAVIAGYARKGLGQEALSIYSRMQQEGLIPDPIAYARLLQACASSGVGALHQGKQLHVSIEDRGLEVDVVLGDLVNMYAKCGSLEDARRMFNKLRRKNVVACNAMIAGYVQQGMGEEALSLHTAVQQEGLTPDFVTYVCLLQACASVGVGALYKGKLLHAEIEGKGFLEDDAVLCASLVNMYVKCGSLEDARRLFDKIPDKTIEAWNALIAGYAHQGTGEEALRLYSVMQQEGLTPSVVTYVCVLHACASVGLGALHEGKQLHVEIEERGLHKDVSVGGSLVDMYAKCGSLEDARKLFDKLADRNVTAWNAMIAGYAQQGMGQEAINLYSSMQQQGFEPDSVTYVSLLQACGAVAALPLGEQLHEEIKERRMQADGKVGAALVNMYAKCGSMYDSLQAFDSLCEKSLEAWNALVSGYAHQGDSEVVFDLLDKMNVEGMKPNEITFLCVLTVCSHVGLVDKGREYFESMRSDYGIPATMKHYICMVDLLGRAGHLHEALEIAENMPVPPNDVLWHTLLGACRKWKNVEVGQQAFKGAVSVDDKDAAAYVLMSNIYASAQMWEATKKMTAMRKESGAWKKPGQSWWTDMDGVVHTFLVGDNKHPDSEGIYSRLKQLLPKLEKEGYVPHLESSLLDVPDEKKQVELCGHSEKLAIAYALNKTAEGTTIRIMKNLRVCEDCHRAFAFISKVEKRTVICRDASRFHVYNEGKCSCRGFW